MSIHLVHPEQYQNQLTEKAAATEAEFRQFNPPPLEVFESPASHFRMRAEFKIWLEDSTANYAMFEPGRAKKPFIIDDFPIGSVHINRLMKSLRDALNRSHRLREKLFQAEFLTSTTDDAVISLIYHRPLDAAWHAEAEALAAELEVNLIGRSRKQKLVIGRDFVNEEFNVKDRQYRYRQVEAAFSQPNAAVCQKMLNWAVDVAGPLAGDLLELYCGNGNFTLPLASEFDKVLATEIAKSSVNTALANMAENKVSNISIARMSSEELTQAMEGVREFRRLEGIDLNSYQFTTIFLDPPRAGLDDGTRNLAKKFQNIIYISCNPETLHRDLIELHATHDVQRIALFDQFPYTEHRECGVLLKLRQ